MEPVSLGVSGVTGVSSGTTAINVLSGINVVVLPKTTFPSLSSNLSALDKSTSFNSALLSLTLNTT